MLHTQVMMMPVPPMNTAMAFNDVIFWVIFGLFVAAFLVVTTLWIIGERRIARKQFHVHEAEWQMPAQSLYTQPQIHDAQSSHQMLEEKIPMQL
jgi:membrane protein YdbS with pleckstrin-like domain